MEKTMEWCIPSEWETGWGAVWCSEERQPLEGEDLACDAGRVTVTGVQLSEL